MAVERLKSWQHDIAERCVYLTESIFERYTRELPDTPDMTDIPNYVHRLQALVEYCMEDEVRAKVLLSLVGHIDPRLYQDLAERGPRGKTGTGTSFRSAIVSDKTLFFFFFARILMCISPQNEN